MTHYFMRDEKNRKWVEVGTPKPADMVSVVRCMDCKFYGYGKYATHCCRFVHKVEPNGFCKWGERK